jgi:hypothetical protein
MPVELWKPVRGRLRLKSVEACEREEWSLLSWPADVSWDPKTGEIVNPSGAEPIRRRFLCGSWRCRRCVRWRGAIDWARCAGAVQSKRWWLYIVLTFDPSQYGGAWEAYLQAGRNWHNHLKPALQAKGGKLAYIQTWEAHRSGWPHANLLVTGDQLRSWVEGMGVELGSTTNGRSSRATKFPRGFRDWLVDKATAAGFGSVLWVEVIDDEVPQALAGYLTKLARELTGAGAGGKADQSPLAAPRHFRRIRASRGLLPKQLAGAANEAAKFTGCLSRTKTGSEPLPRRTTGQRREQVSARWSEVVAALEAAEHRTQNVQGHEQPMNNTDEQSMNNAQGIERALDALANFMNEQSLREDPPMSEMSKDVFRSGSQDAQTKLHRHDCW